MDSIIMLDGLMGSSLVPTIMSIVSGKMYSTNTIDLLYLTVTIGTILATATSSVHLQSRSYTSSRNSLTLSVTSLLTASLFASIVGFHLIRHNFSSTKAYQLPDSIVDLDLSSPDNVFTRHLHADIIPGCILFTQSLICLVIRFDLMNRAKRTFTYGESLIIAQLASMVYLVWALTVYSKLTGAGPFQVCQTNSILLNLGITIFGVVFLPCYLILKRRSTFTRYSLLLLGLVISFVITREIVKTASIDDPLTWLLDYIFSSHQKLSLFSLWVASLAACISFSTSWSRMVGQTNSFVRKIFHVALCVVFISGYNQDLDFTRFAAGGMIIVLFILEMMRAWNLWPIGDHLEKVCQALRGKWDNRYLTLSHIYLLVGIMLPLWLLPSSVGPSKLSLSSGLISVGVGDTAAAIIGSLYGKTELGLKSNKTLEGFVGNIVVMAAFKLIWVGYSGFADEFSFAFAAVLTAFVEVISLNCDNLVLPLVMMFFLEVF